MAAELSTTQIALLEAIKASLFGTETNYPADTDWAEVVKEAKVQTVLGIISPVIPVKDVSVEMGKAKYMRLLFEQDKLVKLLDANGIPCIILKGSAAAQYYPNPHLRAMGDIDILVARDRFENAVEVLESNSYIYIHNKDENGHMLAYERNIVYKKNGIIIELHHHFSSIGYDIDEILEKGIQKRQFREIDGYNIPVLPEIENGLVLIGHIHQHMRGYNLGLRQIIDWEMYIHQVMDNDLWRDSFIKIAKSVGLDKLANNVTSMCMKYFGLPNKIEIDDQCEEVLGDFIKILFENGNFGIKTQDNHTQNSIISFGIYNIKKKGFFPYFQDIGLRKWKSCQKYPILKRFAWIYGILRAIGRSTVLIIKNGNVKAQISEGNKKYDLFKKLGIEASSKTISKK